MQVEIPGISIGGGARSGEWEHLRRLRRTPRGGRNHIQEGQERLEVGRLSQHPTEGFEVLVQGLLYEYQVDRLAGHGGYLGKALQEGRVAHDLSSNHQVEFLEIAELHGGALGLWVYVWGWGWVGVSEW